MCFDGEHGRPPCWRWSVVVLALESKDPCNMRSLWDCPAHTDLPYAPGSHRNPGTVMEFSAICTAVAHA